MSAKPSTILIVDDDKTVIEALLYHFRHLNYEPIATANSHIVEQTLATYEVHLILLDLRMEGIDGYGVLKQLRSKNIQTPVLIITAFYDKEKEKLQTFGIAEEDVIKKPFEDFGQIEARINQKLKITGAISGIASEFDDDIYLNNHTKVMIVDDEPDITEILADSLRERQYEVVIFDNGKDALEYIQNHKEDCHIAIVDMSIPKMSGYQLIPEILKINPKISIIPMSAKYEKDAQKDLLKEGFNITHLMVKPFDLPKFIERVKSLAIQVGALG